jgi:hypothetical protein
LLQSGEGSITTSIQRRSRGAEECRDQVGAALGVDGIGKVEVEVVDCRGESAGVDQEPDVVSLGLLGLEAGIAKGVIGFVAALSARQRGKRQRRL